MFEKEAEEIANKKLCSERICYSHCNFNSPKHHRCGEWHMIYDCAKESAEFGYNKANEWHKVADGGDLPKNNTAVLVILKNKRMKISTFMENKFTIWNNDYDAYTKLYDVIAWCEVPKFEE